MDINEIVERIELPAWCVNAKLTKSCFNYSNIDIDELNNNKDDVEEMQILLFNVDNLDLDMLNLRIPQQLALYMQLYYKIIPFSTNDRHTVSRPILYFIPKHQCVDFMKQQGSICVPYTPENGQKINEELGKKCHFCYDTELEIQTT